MLNVNPFENHVMARILDFLDSKTPWQRGLWEAGVALTIKEVLQASEAVLAGVLSAATLQNLSSHAIELIGRDASFGDDHQKKLLQSSLRSDSKNGGIAFNGVDYRIISNLAAEIGHDYLRRWSVCLRPGHRINRAERVARGIASHLVDCGFSSDYLHRWWNYKTIHDPALYSLSELLEEAHAMLSKPPKDYELLVAFTHAPIPKTKLEPSAWLTNTEVSEWLKAHSFSVRDLRQRGGMKLRINARDIFSAAETAAEIVDGLTTRVSLGTYKSLEPISTVWIVGEKNPIPLRSARRRVEIHALSRENQIYSNLHSAQIDAGIELAASLNTELTSAAIAGGWAAIESLLTGPGDRERILAADRIAAITACSLPRAELTALSYKLEEQGGATALQLKACNSNRDRAAIVAGLIASATPPTFPGESDSAAVARVSDLLLRPDRVLHDIENHLSAAFRRLYRHRNMVLHWGKTKAVGIKSCLRAVAPLVGAGLDRIAHAAFTEKLEPLELAARAEIRLGTLGSPSACSVVDLLETI